MFKNWWEDNWLTDIYLPFDSIFYLHDVIVKNYEGLDAGSTHADAKRGMLCDVHIVSIVSRLCGPSLRSD